jgi:hypothetical protein
MKFAVGDKVIEKARIMARASFPVYQVVGVLDGALLAKFWGDGFDGEIEEDTTRAEFDEPGSRSWREGIVRYQEDEVFSAEEAVAEWKRLGEEKSKLDTEFQELRAKIQSRMDQAAALVKEAQDMAESGWTSSSMRC